MNMTIAFSTYHDGSYNEHDSLAEWAIEQSLGGDASGMVYTVLCDMFNAGHTIWWDIDYSVKDAGEFERQFELIERPGLFDSDDAWRSHLSGLITAEPGAQG